MLSPVKIWRRQKSLRSIIGKKGKVVTWTMIYVAGINFKKQTPYPVVLVEFEDKTRSFGQLVDYEKNDLRINSKVICILRKVRDTSEEGVRGYGIKFKPL